MVVEGLIAAFSAAVSKVGQNRDAIFGCRSQCAVQQCCHERKYGDSSNEQDDTGFTDEEGPANRDDKHPRLEKPPAKGSLQ